MGKRNTVIVIIACLLSLAFNTAIAQKQMPKNLTAFPCEGNDNVPAVIVCPGGSYSWHDWETEGVGVAKWLQSQGFSAYVLKYRVQGVPAFVTHYRLLVRGHQYPDPLNDVQEAIMYLRNNAQILNINPKQIGVMGFSAGGHLSVLSAEYADSDLLRPDFIVTVYPVVTMSDNRYTHKRSRRALLGEYRKFSGKWRDLMSLEKHVSADMPPVFLVNCVDDPIVKYQNSELLDSALTTKGVPHEYHQYRTGGHGFGADTLKAGPEVIQWKQAFINWYNNKFNVVKR